MTLAAQILTGLLRLGLSSLSTWLIRNGVISADQNGEVIAGVALAIVTVVWAVVDKYNVKGWILTALAHPEGTTFNDLQDAIKTSGKVPTGTPDTSVPQLPRLPLIMIAVLMAGLTLAGCAGSLPRIQPLPSQVETADRDIKAVTGNLEQLLTMAARAANTVSKIEDEAARSGVIPTGADASFDQAMLKYVKASTTASNALTSGALTTWPQLKAVVDPVLAQGQALIDTASSLGAIKSKIRGFLEQLGNALSTAVGEYMFGGGR